MKRPVFKKIVKYSFAAGVSAFFVFSSMGAPIRHRAMNMPVVIKSMLSEKYTILYDNLALQSLGLSRDAFNYAIQGMQYLIDAGKLTNADLVSIVDFSLPSSKKRLFVIDLKNGKVVFNTLVSHGRNSGTAVATDFSNEPYSYKSSLGFYVTGDTYNGQHGISLRLEGEEPGINDNALSRGIVMHSANYVNEQMADMQGYIGRSEGCPAVPIGLHKQIIELIKNGTCLFLYSPDRYYMEHSRMIQQQEGEPVMKTDTTVV